MARLGIYPGSLQSSTLPLPGCTPVQPVLLRRPQAECHTAQNKGVKVEKAQGHKAQVFDHESEPDSGSRELTLT